jgi:hypothetical protein
VSKFLLLLLSCFIFCPSAFAIKNPWFPVENYDKELSYKIADKMAIKYGFPEQLHGRIGKNAQVYSYADKHCLYNCKFKLLTIAKMGKSAGRPGNGYEFGIYEVTRWPFWADVLSFPINIPFEWPKNRSDRPTYASQIDAIMADFKAEWEAAKRSTPPQN